MHIRSLFLPCLLLITACSGQEVKETLGLTTQSPDEFVVVSRPPLSVPPDFQLMPPEPGKQGPQHSTEAMAKSALLGDDAGKNHPTSAMDLYLGKDTGGFQSEFSLEGPQSSVDTAVAPVIESEMGSAAESNFLSELGADKADPKIREKLGEDKVNPKKPEKEAGSLYEQLIGADDEEPTVDAKKESERLRDNIDKGKPVNEGEIPTEEKKKKGLLEDWF